MYASMVKHIDIRVAKAFDGFEEDPMITTPMYGPIFPNVTSIRLRLEDPCELTLATAWITESVTQLDVCVSMEVGTGDEWKDSVSALLRALNAHGGPLERLRVQGIRFIQDLFPEDLAATVIFHSRHLKDLRIDSVAINDDMQFALKHCEQLKNLVVYQFGPYIDFAPSRFVGDRSLMPDLAITLHGNVKRLLCMMHHMPVQPGELKLDCWVRSSAMYYIAQLPWTAISCFPTLKCLTIVLALKSDLNQLTSRLRWRDIHHALACQGSLQQLTIDARGLHALEIDDDNLSSFVQSMKNLRELRCLWHNDKQLDPDPELQKIPRLTLTGMVHLAQIADCLEYVHVGHMNLCHFPRASPVLAPHRRPLHVRTITAQTGGTFRTAMVLLSRPPYLELEVDESEACKIVTEAMTYLEAQRWPRCLGFN